MVIITGPDVDVWRYMWRFRSSKDVTHTLITGGSMNIGPQDIHDFRVRVSDSIRYARQLPSINEMRTFHFPLFMDMDYKGTCEALSDAAIECVGACLNETVCKFYDGMEHVDSVICRRGGASVKVDTVNFKHGLHVHWPKIIVDRDRACQIREACIHALDLKDCWQVLLGVDRVDWDDVLDAAPFNDGGGLRMVGCPKATACVCKKRKKKDEDECDCYSDGRCWGQNNQCVVDARAYELFTVMKGESGIWSRLSVYPIIPTSWLDRQRSDAQMIPLLLRSRSRYLPIVPSWTYRCAQRFVGESKRMTCTA